MIIGSWEKFKHLFCRQKFQEFILSSSKTIFPRTFKKVSIYPFYDKYDDAIWWKKLLDSSTLYLLYLYFISYFILRPEKLCLFIIWRKENSKLLKRYPSFTNECCVWFCKFLKFHPPPPHTFPGIIDDFRIFLGRGDFLDQIRLSPRGFIAGRGDF